jgi:hypothetical protein
VVVVVAVVVEAVGQVPYASRCLCKYKNNLMTESDHEPVKIISKSHDLQIHLNGNFTSSSELTNVHEV